MLLIEVVTVFAPRPEHPKWRDYIPMLRMQRDSVNRFGYMHTVVTDEDLGGQFNELRVDLPASLMRAMVAGVCERLKRGGGKLIFVDVDCLIARECDSAFDGSFDLLLTRRDDPVSPINNGAMYVDGDKCLPFFERALELCRDHWGGDQEAISKAAAPVPNDECVQVRDGLRLSFKSMKRHNSVPKAVSRSHSKPYIVHFKGEAKFMMGDYAHMLGASHRLR